MIRRPPRSPLFPYPPLFRSFTPATNSFSAMTLGLATARVDHTAALLPTGLVLITGGRSEEHTSELQSQSNLVCRLLLEKKKKKKQNKHTKRSCTSLAEYDVS